MITIRTPKGVRNIGPGHPAFIIAELSGNHNQDFQRALKMIDAAIEANVDAIKLQTYTPDTMTIDIDNEYFRIGSNNTWAGQTLYELYKTAYTPWEWQAELKSHAESRGVLLFSTPFDPSAVDFLENLDVQLYKVASFELTDIPLLKKIGSTKKPVIISRGMASLEEIVLAVKTLENSGCPSIAILHCISSYPAEAEDMNLLTIPDLRNKFSLPIGLSDHTLGTTTSLVSIALGACIIEKHFTLRRADGGPDAGFSLEPEEFKSLVKEVREAEKSLGSPQYGTTPKESENIVFRRSLFIVKAVKEGEELTEDNVRCIRPGNGINPRFLPEVLGKIAIKDIDAGTPVSWDLIK
jgi:pseudaminic acid synthase